MPLFVGLDGLAGRDHVRAGVYISNGEEEGWWLKVYVVGIYGLGNACILLDLALKNLATQIKFRCVKMIYQIHLECHTSMLVSLFIGFRHVK